MCALSNSQELESRRDSGQPFQHLFPTMKLDGSGALQVPRCFYQSGKNGEHKPKLLCPDIFRWGGGLPCEGVGAKKFGMSLETQESHTFWRDILGIFAAISQGCPKGLTKNSLCSIRVPYSEVRKRDWLSGPVLRDYLSDTPVWRAVGV